MTCYVIIPNIYDREIQRPCFTDSPPALTDCAVAAVGGATCLDAGAAVATRPRGALCDVGLAVGARPVRAAQTAVGAGQVDARPAVQTGQAGGALVHVVPAPPSRPATRTHAQVTCTDRGGSVMILNALLENENVIFENHETTFFY